MTPRRLTSHARTSLYPGEAHAAVAAERVNLVHFRDLYAESVYLRVRVVRHMLRADALHYSGYNPLVSGVMDDPHWDNEIESELDRLDHERPGTPPPPVEDYDTSCYSVLGSGAATPEMGGGLAELAVDAREYRDAIIADQDAAFTASLRMDKARAEAEAEASRIRPVGVAARREAFARRFGGAAAVVTVVAPDDASDTAPRCLGCHESLSGLDGDAWMCEADECRAILCAACAVQASFTCLTPSLPACTWSESGTVLRCPYKCRYYPGLSWASGATSCPECASHNRFVAEIQASDGEEAAAWVDNENEAHAHNAALDARLCCVCGGGGGGGGNQFVLCDVDNCSEGCHQCVARCSSLHSPIKLAD